MKNKAKLITQSLLIYIAMAGEVLAQDAVTNLVMNAGRWIRTLGPLVAIVGSAIGLISVCFGNREGFSWALKAIVAGVLCFAVGSLIRLVQGWVGFAAF